MARLFECGKQCRPLETKVHESFVWISSDIRTGTNQRRGNSMNKTLPLMAGLGLGAVLVCLFGRAKKKPRGRLACDGATNVLSNDENVIGAPPSRISRRAHATDASAIPGRTMSRRSAMEATVNDCVAKLSKPEPHESPQTGSNLGSTRGSILSGCLCDFREAGRLDGTGSGWSLARWMWPGVVRGGRLVYRLICRVSFRVCLCTAGLRILRRVFTDKPMSRLADLTHQKFSKKEYLLMTGSMSLAFLSRLSILRLRQPTLTPDGVYYATLGKHLASGNFKEGLSTFWSPLYPLLVAVSSLVSRDMETGGRLVSVLAGSLLVVPVYLLVRVLYGEDTAFIGALLIAAHPILIHYSTLLLTESTYTLLFATALLAGLTTLSSLKRRAFFATGVALGACYLTRPEAIGYAWLMLALALSAHHSVGHLPSSGALFNVLSLMLGFSLLALPYILFLRRATGRWTVSDKLRAHIHSTESRARWWYGLPEGRQTTLADRLYAGVPQEGASSDQGAPILPDAHDLQRMAGRSVEALKSEIRLLVYHLTPPQFVVLIGLGLFKTEWSKEIYLLLFLSSTLAGYALCPDDVSDRLLVPLLPLLLCWVAKGINEIENRLVGLLTRVNIPKSFLFKHPALIRSLVLTALLISLLPWLANTIILTRGLPNQLLEYKQAGAWVKEHSETPTLIMSTGPHTAFYAGGKPLYLPVEEYSTVIEHARRHKVDYLVIDEEVISTNVEYSNLRFLLDEQSRHPGLKLAYKFDGVPNRKILIFTLT